MKHKYFLRPNSQRGVSLFMVLVAVLVLSLGAAALIRSVDTASLISGNIAFKKAATAAADTGMEAAILALDAHKNTDTFLNGREPNIGNINAYYACEDPSKKYYEAVNWDATSGLGIVADAKLNCGEKRVPSASVNIGNGYSYQYSISRMCTYNSGDDVYSTSKMVDSGFSCTETVKGGNSPNRSTACTERGKEGECEGIKQRSYRILVRTTGPRNTVSFTESIIYFTD